MVEGESFTGPYCDTGLIHRWGLYTLARMAGVRLVRDIVCGIPKRRFCRRVLRFFGVMGACFVLELLSVML